MNISLVQGSSTLQLNGSGVSAPIKAARFADESLTELEVVCEGTAASIAGVTDSIGVKLFEAGRVWGLIGENQVYVQLTLPDGVTWRSPIKAGVVNSVRGPAGRKVNGQALRVSLVRAEWWEKASLQYCSLSNAQGSSSGAGGLAVYNHNDAAHNCYVDIAATEGDLPAPAVLTITKASVANLESYIGMGSFLDRPNVKLFFEGESGASGAGVTATGQASGANSNGNYINLAWNGSTEVVARFFTLSAAETSALAGRVFRPILRLHSQITGGEKMWMRVVLNYETGGPSLEAIYASEAVLLPTDRLMMVLPALCIPPWQVLDVTSQAVTISLQVLEEGGGANTLNLDEMFLLPLDSSLHLTPVVTSYPNTTIVYDCGSGVMVNDSRSILTHLPEGPGISLVPGRLQRLVYVFRAGTGWDITLNPVVNVQYRPRKRTL